MTEIKGLLEVKTTQKNKKYKYLHVVGGKDYYFIAETTPNFYLLHTIGENGELGYPLKNKGFFFEPSLEDVIDGYQQSIDYYKEGTCTQVYNNLDEQGLENFISQEGELMQLYNLKLHKQDLYQDIYVDKDNMFILHLIKDGAESQAVCIKSNNAKAFEHELSMI